MRLRDVKPAEPIIGFRVAGAASSHCRPYPGLDEAQPSEDMGERGVPNGGQRRCGHDPAKND